MKPKTTMTPQNESKATPRFSIMLHYKNYPVYDDQGKHIGIYGPPHSDGEDYAPLCRVNDERLAALIVQAVNEREALLAVEQAAENVSWAETLLEKYVNGPADHETYIRNRTEAINQLRQALAKLAEKRKGKI